MTIYLVRDGRLEPVTRSSSDTSISSALAFLSEGPERREIRSRFETALGREPLIPGRVSGSHTVTVSASSAYATIAGDSQLLATAQLVWTVTEHPSVKRVRISVDGEVLQLPTDKGLARTPVGRGDYRSVAPNVVDREAPGR